MYSPFFETGRQHDEYVEREVGENIGRSSGKRAQKPPMTDADRKQWSIENKMNNECDCTADELFAGAHYSSCKWVRGMSAEELATTSKQII